MPYLFSPMFCCGLIVCANMLETLDPSIGFIYSSRSCISLYPSVGRVFSSIDFMLFLRLPARFCGCFLTCPVLALRGLLLARVTPRNKQDYGPPREWLRGSVYRKPSLCIIWSVFSRDSLAVQVVGAQRNLLYRHLQLCFIHYVSHEITWLELLYRVRY